MPRTALLCAAVVATANLALAQQTVTKGELITGQATIEAIDRTSRTLTVRYEDKTADTVDVGPEVKRFNELNVGDRIMVKYYESAVVQLRKAGDTANTADDRTSVIPKGTTGTPGATIARQVRATVEVTAIDEQAPSITVKAQDGRIVSRKIEDRRNLRNVKVGDRLDITYTRAAVIAVEPAK